MRRLFLSACILAVLLPTAGSAYEIRDDIGGRIGDYIEKFAQIRASGETVMINGMCLSACTLVLGIIPRSRICAAKDAMFGFHEAWARGPDGHPVPSAVGTQALKDLYPPDVRRRISSHGGLKQKMFFLSAAELGIRECADDAYAQQHGAPLTSIYRIDAQAP